MRLVWIFLILVFAVAGAIFGVLNGETVGYDFYFTTVRAPKGVALIGAVSLGWLLGGALAYFGLASRLRRRAQMRKAPRVDRGAAASAAPVVRSESATGNDR